MDINQGLEFYKRLLTERHKLLTESLLNFANQLQRESKVGKLDAAKDVQSKIKGLRDGLPGSDVPSWLTTIQTEVDRYVQSNGDTGLAVLVALMETYNAVHQHKWGFVDEPLKGAVDFASIYQQAYSESRIPALFEELIAQINALIASGAIDSVKAIQRLEKLVATLRKNVRGDYLSTLGTWKVLRTLGVNLGLESLESIPIVKQITKAVRKTFADLDIEFKHVAETFNRRLSEQLPHDLPPLLEAHKEPLMLPSAPDADFIEAEFIAEAGDNGKHPAPQTPPSTIGHAVKPVT